MSDTYDPFASEKFVNPLVKQKLENAVTLPKRAIESSAYALQSGHYDPSVPMEAAGLLMNTSPLAKTGALGVAGGRLKGGELPKIGAKDFYEKFAINQPANENARYVIPPPLPQFERDWQNYFSKMKPEEVMPSEPAWGAVARARAAGLDQGVEFSNYVNQAWQRMGANKYITPDIANRYIRLEEGRARGIGVVEQKT